MIEAGELMQSLDVLMLLYGEVGVVSPESFLLGRLTFCELMRAEVPDQIAALQYTTGYAEALTQGEDVTTEWVMGDGSTPVSLGIRLLTEMVCGAIISQAEDMGESPLRPVALEASHRLMDFLVSFQKVLLAAVRDYPGNHRLRGKAKKDLLAALTQLEETGVIDSLRGVNVQESGQMLLM